MYLEKDKNTTEGNEMNISKTSKTLLKCFTQHIAKQKQDEIVAFEAITAKRQELYRMYPSELVDDVLGKLPHQTLPNSVSPAVKVELVAPPPMAISHTAGKNPVASKPSQKPFTKVKPHIVDAIRQLRAKGEFGIEDITHMLKTWRVNFNPHHVSLALSKGDIVGVICKRKEGRKNVYTTSGDISVRR